jgi:GT2 family glycosyltransferase
MIPELSVVIVAYRCRDIVLGCLTSLYDQGGLAGVDAQVLLADNASGDDTIACVHERFPQVEADALPDNIGFARANNVLLRRTTGRSVLLLNPDTIVPDGALRRCLDHLAVLPEDYGALGCRLEGVDGRLQPECARALVTPWSESCRALGLDRLFPRSARFNPEAMPGWDRTTERDVESLLGAFILLRRAALDAVVGFDEGYFLMYEDTDLCRRLADAGFRLRFWPGVTVTHLGGASWKQEKIATYAATHASALRYIARHYPRSLGAVRAIVRVGMELKILALRARGADGWSAERLAMARAAREALRAS